jgi:hypothetical protein
MHYTSSLFLWTINYALNGELCSPLTDVYVSHIVGLASDGSKPVVGEAAAVAGNSLCGCAGRAASSALFLVCTFARGTRQRQSASTRLCERIGLVPLRRILCALFPLLTTGLRA